MNYLYLVFGGGVSLIIGFILWHVYRYAQLKQERDLYKEVAHEAKEYASKIADRSDADYIRNVVWGPEAPKSKKAITSKAVRGSNSKSKKSDVRKKRPKTKAK